MYNYTGTIKAIGETQQVTEKFTKRELILTDNAASYPQTCLFTFTQKNCSLLDGLSLGQEVTVSFSLKGREWKDKVFNELSAFKVVAGAKATKNAFNETFTEDLPF